MSTRGILADLDGRDRVAKHRALGILLAETWLDEPPARREALELMRALGRRPQSLRQVEGVLRRAGRAVRERVDLARARLPGAFGPLFEIVPPSEAMVLWLWRDDLRHRPLWLVRRDPEIVVALGAGERPAPVPGEPLSEPDHAIGRIGPGGAAERGAGWTREVDVELARLAAHGLSYARVKAIMAGRCMYYGLSLGEPADLSGVCAVARRHQRARLERRNAAR